MTTDWAWETAHHMVTEHGAHVFPLRPYDKIPYHGFHWDQESSASRVKLAWWLHEYPCSNYAIDLAKSGLLVIDVDVKAKDQSGDYEFTRAGYDNLNALLSQHNHWDFDGHMTAGTGSGGWHWWLQQPDPPLKGRTGTGRRAPLGQHIDIKSAGGYALLPGCSVPPPFKHPLADGFYRPESTATLDPQPAPSWLVGLLREAEQPTREPDPYRELLAEAGIAWDRINRPPGRGRERLAGLRRVVAEASSGGRNSTLNWASWQAREAVAEGDFTITEFVAAMNDATTRNGLIADDGHGPVSATIASGLGVQTGTVIGAW